MATIPFGVRLQPEELRQLKALASEQNKPHTVLAQEFIKMNLQQQSEQQKTQAA